MHREVKYCDISEADGANCWIVNLLPFNKAECGDGEILSYQLSCIKNKIFGMGWQSEHLFKNRSVSLNEENRKEYTKYYDGGSAMENALKNYANIKAGDFVMIRIKNSHVYIGKISEKAKYNSNNIDEANRMSWYCRVESWAEFESSENLPSEIRGRLSQRRQPTVTRVASYRQKLLMIKAYQTKIYGKSTIPTVVIGKNNFCRCLDYKQLEDLVCMYIYKRNKNYILLPSSCKISQQKYEYTFLSPDDHPISCQVKNQSEINIDEYVGDTGFKRIYIFSGIWSEDAVRQKREEYKKYTHIEIISPAELYDELKEFTYLHEALGDYYEFSEPDITNLDTFAADITKNGWSAVKEQDELSKNPESFLIKGDTIYFGTDKLWYWQEINALCKSAGDVSDEAVRAVKEIIDKTLNKKS